MGRRDQLIALYSVLHEQERRRCEQDFGFFAKRAWHTIEPGTQYIHGYHVEAIIDHLVACLPRTQIIEAVDPLFGVSSRRVVKSPGQIRKLLITMPPRHMKSTLLVLFNAWVWTFMPEYRWLHSSYALSLSIRDTMKVRAVVMSPWYQVLWGSRFNLLADQNSKDKFYNSAMGYRMSTSPDAAATGEGGDMVAVDDAHNVAEADSVARRDHTKNWWFESMGSRGNDPETVTHLVMMQRVHQDDLPAECISRGYVHLNLPARYDPMRRCVTVLGWEDWRKEPGELLWPRRFSEKAMLQLETDLGPFGVASQLQQDPRPRGGAFIKRDWFSRRMTARDLGFVGPITWIRAWDLALSAASRDECASIEMGVGLDGTRYWRRGLFWHKDWAESLERIRTVGQWERNRVRIEAIGTTLSAGRQAKDALLGFCLAETQESKKDKVSTAIKWIPRAEAGQVVIVDETVDEFPLFAFNPGPWVEHFLDVLTSWKPDPTLSQRDDVLDAISSADETLAANVPLGDTIPSSSAPSVFDSPRAIHFLSVDDDEDDDFDLDDDDRWGGVC